MQAYEQLAASQLTGSASKIKRAIKSTSLLPAARPLGEENRPPQTVFNDAQAKADAALMRNLRDQIEALERDLRKSEEDKQRLEVAVRRREAELSQAIQKTSSVALLAGVNSDSNRLDMLTMADSANARIIDQLNGQVDFLNDQLAQREAQLAEVGEQLLAAHEIKLECDNR